MRHLPDQRQHVKRIAITQSNYLPWKGYFHVIGRVDELVLYDEVQYTRRDWRNRNVIKTQSGLKWITVPVQVKGRFTQCIDETMITDEPWSASHWGSIEQAYRRAPYFDDVAAILAPYYLAPTPKRLSDVNRDLLELVMGALGVCTQIRWSTDYEHDSQDRTDRLVSICLQAGATEYLTGPAARNYLDEEQFERAGIALTYVDYSVFPPYPQLHGEFVHEVSIIDMLFNAGRDVGHLLALDRP